MINTSFVKVLVLVLVGLPHLCFGDIAWSDDPAFSSLTVPSDFSSRTSVSVPVQTDVSVYKCAGGCVSNANCSSFLYHPPTRRCKYVLAVFTRKDHLVAKSGMEYWRIRDDECPINKCFYRLRALCLAMYIRNTSVSYNMSVDICNGDNATLATITTRAQLDAVMEMLRHNVDANKTYKSAYVDGRRKLNTTVEYQFEWNDGTLLPMWNESQPGNLWSPGEPSSDRGKGEDCLAIRADGWFDFTCEDLLRGPTLVICQRKL